MRNIIQVYSIFQSISGEVGFGQGKPCTFIRFAGCMHPPCKWCDTKYALDPNSGEEMTVDEIRMKVVELGCQTVMITGGEPLMQPEGFNELIVALHNGGFHVAVETNGAFDIRNVKDRERVYWWIVDYKTPSSGVHHKMVKPMFYSLNHMDWIKFVIADEEDYIFSRDIVQEFKVSGCQANIAFSPMSVGAITPSELTHKIIKDKLFYVTLNLQLHKLAAIQESK